MSAIEKLGASKPPACVDLDAERRYLGALMADAEVATLWPLDVRDVWHRAHQAILEACIQLAARRQSTDPSSVCIELARCGSLERAGGRPGVESVAQVIELHPEALQSRLRELAVARRAREHAARSISLFELGDIPEGLRELREGAELRSPTEGDSSRFGTARTAVADAVTDLQSRARRSRPAFVKTHITSLDLVIGGMEYGDVNVIGAESGVGKSTTALMMALHQARSGHRPGYISCEDGSLRVGRRIVNMLTGISAKAMRVGKLSTTQWESLSGAVATVCDSELHCAWCEGEDLDRVEDAMRVLINERGCDVIYLDYLQAVEVPQGRGDTPKDHMRRVMAAVRRAVSRASNPPCAVLMSQVRKRVNETEPPTLADLYESAYIRQKADSIFMLWKDQHGDRMGLLAKAKDGDGREGTPFALDFPDLGADKHTREIPW